MSKRRERETAFVFDASLCGQYMQDDVRGERCRCYFAQFLAEEAFVLVYSSEILEEWKRHQHSSTREWLSYLFGRRRVRKINVQPGEELRRGLERVALGSTQRKALEKDLHLVDASLAHEARISSADDVARGLFSKVAQEITRLRAVVWVNPGTMPLDETSRWFALLAPPEEGKCLGD